MNRRRIVLTDFHVSFSTIKSKHGKLTVLSFYDAARGWVAATGVLNAHLAAETDEDTILTLEVNADYYNGPLEDPQIAA